MKKIKYFTLCLLFLFCFTISLNKVSATTMDCDSQSYQCITCTYGDITYYVNSDGAGSGTVVDNYDIAQGAASVTVQGDVSFTNFYSSSSKKLVCNPTIYRKKTSSGRSMTITDSFNAPTNDSATDMISAISLSSSTDNKKGAVTITSKYSEPLSCYFADANNNKATVIRGTDGKLTCSIPSGYKSISNQLDDSLFDKECPKTGVYLYCDSRSQTCSLTTTQINSNETVTGETENSDVLNGQEEETTKEEESTNSDGCPIFGDPTNKDDFAYYLQSAFNIIKFAGILIAIIMTIKDLMVAITSGKDESLKKVGQKVIKRLLYAILIFFLPNIINFFFGIIGLYGTCVS